MSTREEVPEHSSAMAAIIPEDDIRGNDIEGTRDTGVDTPKFPFPGQSDPEKVGEQEPPAEPTRNSKKPLSFYMAFLSLLMMVLIVSLDATILPVALPKISNEIGGTTLQSFWASLVFTLAVVVVQPIYTSVSNVMGRKMVLYAAFVLFAVGSIVFAVAPNMGILIFGRTIQGLGGGGLDVLSEVITADITTLKERAFWIGMLSVPMAAGCIIGPILGAVFSSYANWRWIGWINLPLVAIAMALAVMFMRLKTFETSVLSRLAKIDWIGMAIFTTGCALVSVPLSWAGVMYPWASWKTLLPLIIGIFVLVSLAIYEKYPQEAVFPYRIFKSRTAALCLLGSFIHGMVLYTLLLYLPLFFQAVFLESGLQSAISILPFCALVMCCTGAAAWLVDFVRHYRWVMWAGWVFLSVGTGLFALWNEHRGATTSRALSATFQVISGIGIGTNFVVPCIPMQASASAADQGLAGGIMVSFRLFGALIGLAIGSTTFNNVYAKAIGDIPIPQALQKFTDPNAAVALIQNLRDLDVSPDVLSAIREAYRVSMKDIFIVLAAFGALGFVSSLFVKELSMETDELGDQHYDY
ncbi:hypothetical protein VPNG_07162 [Cytospora leucostoma]|uniref:Major facilitator superfamily (MFS) profile domain-containing protein n=1 Tax=Cytospora leucostoma TaxID=1230097 RepID=A0A423WJP3_9PEZI|nr:hypothetical protein VPNG_07162 [Cytospora leucostoma]